MADPNDDTLQPEAGLAVHPREPQIFPRLDAEMIDRMRRFGTAETPAEGSFLFHRGDRGVDFFVVLEGAVELVEEGAGSGSALFRRYGPGEFTGELYLFNDRKVLVAARATADTQVLRIGHDAFRRLVSTEADIGELLMRAFILRRVELIATGFGGVTLLGSAHGADTHRLRAFLIRNAYPHKLLDPDTDDRAGEMLEAFGLSAEALPVLLLDDGTLLRDPEIADVADALGLTEPRDARHRFDVAVVGGGPAGLAAAVYAASEGLSTIVIEADAPGGQAGTSTRIENYLGFPTGISGQALAGRAQVQAQKFGAQLAISRAAATLDCSARPFVVTLEDGETIRADSIVVATGARYRKLDLPGYDRLEGCGIYYAATPMEAQLCRSEEAVVVGGGNSAGQAAVFLSGTCSHVHVLVRGPGLAATMSDYLVQRILNSPRITLHSFTEVVAVEGEDYLSRVTWQNRQTGQRTTRDVRNLFVMIGAVPNTGWLQACVPLDQAGFIVAGKDAAGVPLSSPYATQVPGIFTVGDVRSGSVKRVASAVGEGSVVVSAIHAYLAEQRQD